MFFWEYFEIFKNNNSEEHLQIVAYIIINLMKRDDIADQDKEGRVTVIV